MRLPGYCTQCHRIKQVNVSGHALAMAGRRAVQGVCSACQDAADNRTQRRTMPDDGGGMLRRTPIPSEFCEPCGFVHDGPLCVCGERLYAKGRGGKNLSRWQHVHTAGQIDHTPTPQNHRSVES